MTTLVASITLHVQNESYLWACWNIGVEEFNPRFRLIGQYERKQELRLVKS